MASFLASTVRIYLDVIRFNFLRFLAYPIEIWAAIIKRVLNIGFLLIFWSIIAKSSHGSIQLTPLIAYFLISSAVNDTVSAESLRFAKYVGNTIKRGTITTYLIRPLSIVPYLYSSSLGERSLSLILSGLCFVLGLILYPPTSPLSVLLFFIFLLFASVISLAINLMMAIIYFYAPEAGNFRLSLAHLIKVFSGAIVPLTFFPAGLKRAALLSPFPALIFTPVSSLHYTQLTASVLMSLALSLGWALILLTAAGLWWKHAIKNYDAIGI